MSHERVQYIRERYSVFDLTTRNNKYINIALYSLLMFYLGDIGEGRRAVLAGEVVTHSRRRVRVSKEEEDDKFKTVVVLHLSYFTLAKLNILDKLLGSCR